MATPHPNPTSPVSLDDLAIEALRAATPGTRTTLHFNHAGASLPSAATVHAMQEQMRRETEMGPMEAGVVGREQTERARLLAARLLNAQPSEIALTAGNSLGWGLAFASLPSWKPGDRILVARHEWGGNLAAMQLAARRFGVEVQCIPSDASGVVDVDALQAMLDERVRLIALTWLPANGGLINPAAAVGAVARRHGIPYFVDAAQALGQLPIDVGKVGCDVLAGACRKALRGPRGTGLLYVRQDFLPQLTPPLADIHSAPLDDHGTSVLREDATRFEPAETAMLLRCGLANALDEALRLGVGNIRARIDRNAQRLRSELGAVAGVTVLDQGCEKSGLVAFDVAGRAPAQVQQLLAGQGISISSNGVRYTPLDMQARGLDTVARASVSYLTTDAEIDQLTRAIRGLAA